MNMMWVKEISISILHSWYWKGFSGCFTWIKLFLSDGYQCWGSLVFSRCSKDFLILEECGVPLKVPNWCELIFRKKFKWLREHAKVKNRSNISKGAISERLSRFFEVELKKNCQGSQLTWKLGKSGNLKWTFFYWKVGIIREFWLNIRDIREN